MRQTHLMIMSKPHLLPILAAAIIFKACVIQPPPDDKTVNRVNIGDKVPSFDVAGPSGAFNSPAGFSGKTSVLLLFNTNCSDCAREMPKIYALWQKINDNPALQVVSIARGQTAEEVGSKWKYGKMNYYLDTDRSVFEKFANLKIPRIYIVDKSGMVRWMAIEYLLNENRTEMTADQFEKIFMGYVN